MRNFADAEWEFYSKGMNLMALAQSRCIIYMGGRQMTGSVGFSRKGFLIPCCLLKKFLNTCFAHFLFIFFFLLFRSVGQFAYKFMVVLIWCYFFKTSYLCLWKWVFSLKYSTGTAACLRKEKQEWNLKRVSWLGQYWIDECV